MSVDINVARRTLEVLNMEVCLIEGDSARKVNRKIGEVIKLLTPETDDSKPTLNYVDELNKLYAMAVKQDNAALALDILNIMNSWL